MGLIDANELKKHIKRSATRTAIIVSHIETMFGLYEAYCDKAQNAELERRRYNVVWDLYMAEQPMTTKEVANKMNISKETVYLDQNIALERLTALIFGVDGLYAK